MKKVLALVLLALAIGVVSNTSAQTTAFTYQGSLKDGTNQANGTYDLQFRLWDASSPIAGPITLEDVPVTNGVFSVNLDFGASALPGADRYLEISVRPGASTGAFTTLAPRQQVTSSPYAMQAAFAGNATTADTALNANNAANAQNADAVGGTPADQVIKEGDPRLTDMRQPTAGSASYVQINPSSPQTGNFDILGNAKVRSTLDVQGQTTLRSNTFVLGTLSGNGSGLTNLNAANVTGLGSLATVTPAVPQISRLSFAATIRGAGRRCTCYQRRIAAQAPRQPSAGIIRSEMAPSAFRRKTLRCRCLTRAHWVRLR